MDIRTLEEYKFDELFTAWEDAFSDYERQWDRDELQRMLRRRGYRPELSYGAVEDGRLLSFTLNGIGEWRGQHTAYDTGTGTVREARGKGLSRKIFDFALPHLRAAGVQQYLLEVLQHNATALKIYQDAGFQIIREFNYFGQMMSELSIPEGNTEVAIHSISLDLDAQMEQMWDFEPSWQNSFASIRRDLDSFEIIGAYRDEQLVGYGILEPASGDIAQLAVGREHRRRGIGTRLLKEMLQRNKRDTAKVVNTDTRDTAITNFLVKYNIPERGKQFEMVLEI